MPEYDLRCCRSYFRRFFRLEFSPPNLIILFSAKFSFMGLAELKEAQAFPFSESAERIVKQSGLSAEDIPSPVLQRAIQIVEAVAVGKNYWQDVQQYEEFLERDVLAFPVAKILLSLTKNQSLYERFAEQVSENAFEQLEKSPEKALDLGQELGLKVALAEKPFFISLSLNDFLAAQHGLPYLKLVNSRVEKGIVFLNKEEFLQVLKDSVKQRVRDSLPILLQKPSQALKEKAALLGQQLFQRQQKMDENILKGKLDLNALPPCMAKIYADLLKGENVNHSARFNIAVFMNAIGMPKESIVQLFSRTPNWNERVSRYQVEGLLQKKYTPANCDTMQSYALCVKSANGEQCACKVAGAKTPRQWYRRNWGNKVDSD